MLKHYFLSAFRSLKKNWWFSVVNIIGLASGITLSLLFLLFLISETSYDNFHSKKDRIFRINKEVSLENGVTARNAETSGLIGPMLYESNSEIESFVRYAPQYQDILLKNGEEYAVIKPGKFAYTDSSFLEIFDFELIKGNPKTALIKPQSIVITEKVSNALFKSEDPIGKTIVNNDLLLQVTGVIKSPPKNSHIDFEAIVSWTTTVPNVGQLNIGWMNNLVTQGICTYVLLKNESTDLNAAFADFMSTHMPDYKKRYAFYIQPLSELYLHSDDVSGLRMGRVGNMIYINFLSISCAFILLIACINYINITVARSIKRAKEVGVRKVIGAKKKQLFFQYFSETAILTIAALLMSIGFVILALPYFNDLIDRELVASMLLKPVILVSMAGLMLFVAFIAGIYPSVILSSQKPVAALKNQALVQKTGLRNLLIGVQLVACFITISYSIIIYRQIELITNQDLGFNYENLLILPLSKSLSSNPQPLINELKSISDISEVSSSFTALGSGSSSSFVIPEGQSEEIESRLYYLDEDFFKTYELTIESGRFFDKDLSENENIVINASMLELLGWVDPLGKSIEFNNGRQYKIVGVVKDFNFNAIAYNSNSPAILIYDPTYPEYISVRSTASHSQLIETIDPIWKKHEPYQPFDYYFADNYIKDLYKGETKLLKSIVLYAVFSIFLSVLGLLGVLTVELNSKQKELAIRKVLGVSLPDLIILFSKKYVLLIILAQVVCVPIIFKFTGDWLDRYRIKTTIDTEVFLISFGIVAATAMSTIVFQIIRASKTNSIELLRRD